MLTSEWTDANTAASLRIWAEYQQQHDVSAYRNRTAGIDPITAQVWFGETAQDIWRQRQALGLNSPIYCVRVGADYYIRKGGHRYRRFHV